MQRLLSLQTDIIPYMVRLNTSDAEAGYEGFLVDLLDELAKDVGFEYVLEESSRYGRLDQESGNWTGLIGKLLNKVRMEGHMLVSLIVELWDYISANMNSLVRSSREWKQGKSFSIPGSRFRGRRLDRDAAKEPGRRLLGPVSNVRIDGRHEGEQVLAQLLCPYNNQKDVCSIQKCLI